MDDEAKAGNSKMKPAFFLGSSNADLRDCPDAVQNFIGYAIGFAQEGFKHDRAKPLKGFGGAGVLEVIANHHGDTYRAVYTMRFAEAVYVLHVFQKKSKSGIATPKHEIKLINRRLREAEEKHQKWLKEQRDA
jgi:phage-related protein